MPLPTPCPCHSWLYVLPTPCSACLSLPAPHPADLTFGWLFLLSTPHLAGFRSCWLDLLLTPHLAELISCWLNLLLTPHLALPHGLPHLGLEQGMPCLKWCMPCALPYKNTPPDSLGTLIHHPAAGPRALPGRIHVHHLPALCPLLLAPSESTPIRSTHAAWMFWSPWTAPSF